MEFAGKFQWLALLSRTERDLKEEKKVSSPQGATKRNLPHHTQHGWSRPMKKVQTTRLKVSNTLPLMYFFLCFKRLCKIAAEYPRYGKLVLLFSHMGLLKDMLTENYISFMPK